MKKPALVAVHGGGEQDEPVEAGFEALHEAGNLRGRSRTRGVESGVAHAKDRDHAPAAQGHQTLSAYISSRFDEFSRSQKDVAQYVVDHLDEVAFHTAEELARRASTSSSTVVRFSQALGFEGFPELQEAAREEYRHLHRKADPAQRDRDRDAAVLARPEPVRVRHRRRPRQRGGDGAQGLALAGRGRHRGDRRRTRRC